MLNSKPVLAAVLVVFVCRDALSADLAELAQAQSGAVVELPAGTFAGGFTVPPGVTLRGAGYQQTVIEARSAAGSEGHSAAGSEGHSAAAAISVTGQGAKIENLRVDSSGVGIDLSAAEDVAVRRVMILGGTTGIRAGQVDRATIENVIVARALIGISLNQAARSTVANCTVFTADACGLSVSQATDTAVFNNLVVNAGTGVVVGGENRNLALDYNLYVARNGAEKSVDLYRIDPVAGTPIPRPDGRLCVNLKGKFQSQYLGGIAELDGKLYAADTDVDKVLFGSVDRPRSRGSQTPP